MSGETLWHHACTVAHPWSFHLDHQILAWTINDGNAKQKLKHTAHGLHSHRTNNHRNGPRNRYWIWHRGNHPRSLNPSSLGCCPRIRIVHREGSPLLHSQPCRRCDGKSQHYHQRRQSKLQRNAGPQWRRRSRYHDRHASRRRYLRQRRDDRVRLARPYMEHRRRHNVVQRPGLIQITGGW